jgi:hypothetical protein
MRKWSGAIPLSELLGGAMTRDLNWPERRPRRKSLLVGDETVVVTGLDVNGVLHEHSPLEAQLQATLNIVPASAWYGFQR